MTEQRSLSAAELVETFAHLPVEHDTIEHYRGYLRRELVLNRCAECSRWHHPMRPICPACWSWSVIPNAASGRGTVYLVTLLHQGPPADGVDYGRGPHPVVTVELDGAPGIRLISNVLDVDPARLAIGMPVVLAWDEPQPGVVLPRFRPA